MFGDVDSLPDAERAAQEELQNAAKEVAKQETAMLYIDLYEKHADDKEQCAVCRRGFHEGELAKFKQALANRRAVLPQLEAEAKESLRQAEAAAARLQRAKPVVEEVAKLKLDLGAARGEMDTCAGSAPSCFSARLLSPSAFRPAARTPPLRPFHLQPPPFSHASLRCPARAVLSAPLPSPYSFPSRLRSLTAQSKEAHARVAELEEASKELGSRCGELEGLMGEARVVEALLKEAATLRDRAQRQDAEAQRAAGGSGPIDEEQARDWRREAEPIHCCFGRSLRRPVARLMLIPAPLSLTALLAPPVLGTAPRRHRRR